VDGEDDHQDRDDPTREWVADMGFQCQGDCISFLVNWLTAMGREGSLAVVLNRTAIMTKNDTTIMTTPRCLPDTINPRRPKEK
jgi:hypothetical protein